MKGNCHDVSCSNSSHLRSWEHLDWLSKRQTLQLKYTSFIYLKLKPPKKHDVWLYQSGLLNTRGSMLDLYCLHMGVLKLDTERPSAPGWPVCGCHCKLWPPWSIPQLNILIDDLKEILEICFAMFFYNTSINTLAHNLLWACFNRSGLKLVLIHGEMNLFTFAEL